MSDDQFKMTLVGVSAAYSEGAADMLRARDTAQREALARVEAERAIWMDQYDSVVRYGNELLAKHDTAQAQLAEAVGLLEQLTNTGCWDVSNSALVERACDIWMAHRDAKHSKTKNAQAEQQEATKRGKPDWNSHSYDQIFQTSDGNWFGARADWDFKGHISDGWKGREVSLLRDDGGFLAYGEQNPDWENSLEQRPVQEAQGAQAGDERAAFEGALIQLARENGRTLDHRHFDRSIQTGKYFKAVLESQWATWQARAALAAQPAVQSQANEFHHGIFYAVAELQRSFEMTTMCAGILRAAGLDDADCSSVDEFDRISLREIAALSSLNLTGLDGQPAVRGAEHE